MAVQWEAIPVPSHRLQLNIFPLLLEEIQLRVLTVSVKTAQLENSIPQTLQKERKQLVPDVQIEENSKAESLQTSKSLHLVPFASRNS